MYRRAPSDAAAVIGAAWPCIWLQAHLLGVEHRVCSLLRECALAMPYALAVGHARLSRRDAGCSVVVSSALERDHKLRDRV